MPALSGPDTEAAVPLVATGEDSSGVGVASREAESVTADIGRPRAAFYGDSVATGVGLDDRSRRWPTLVCRRFGWEERNLAVNGAGFLRRRARLPDGTRVDDDGDLETVNAVIRTAAVVVFVSAGTNDAPLAASDPDRLLQRMRADIALIRRGLPAAMMVMVEPYYPRHVFTPGFALVRSLFHQVAAESQSLLIEGPATLVRGDANILGPDTVHPSERGHAAIADCIITALPTDVGATTAASGR